MRGGVPSLNLSGDKEGCKRHPTCTVTTPKGYKAAYDAYREGGWLGLSAPAQYGGQELPTVINSIMQEFISSSNLALGMYPGLTQGPLAAFSCTPMTTSRRPMCRRC